METDFWCSLAVELFFSFYNQFLKNMFVINDSTVQHC